MSSEWQILFNVAVGIIGALGGILIKIILSEQKSMRDAHEKLRSDLTDNYVRRDDFKEFMQAMFNKLDRIEIKIDQKADK